MSSSPRRARTSSIEDDEWKSDEDRMKYLDGLRKKKGKKQSGPSAVRRRNETSTTLKKKPLKDKKKKSKLFARGKDKKKKTVDDPGFDNVSEDIDLSVLQLGSRSALKPKSTWAVDHYPEIVDAMRDATEDTKKVLRFDTLFKFRDTTTYQKYAKKDESFWFDAIPEVPNDWSSSFKGAPKSGYKLFLKFCKEQEADGLLNFLTAARELESLECKSGEYLMKFNEVFMMYFDSDVELYFAAEKERIQNMRVMAEATKAISELNARSINISGRTMGHLRDAHGLYFTEAKYNRE